jgi:hypothetical protein
MKVEISNIENMTTIILNTTNITHINVQWLLQWHNISTEDLNLAVLAPSLCLNGTNWVAWAHVQDRYGFTLGYEDVWCSMTTDLWGTANMTFDYVRAMFKYIHKCNPTNTTFYWSVNCERII